MNHIKISRGGWQSRFKLLDVDRHGYYYLINFDTKIAEKRDINGRILTQFTPSNVEELRAACVDRTDAFHGITSKSIINYNQNGKLISSAEIPGLSGNVIDAKCSKSSDTIFILSVSTAGSTSDLILYGFDSNLKQTSIIHKVHIPYVYDEISGLGKIDFTIADDRLCVSDNEDYKIYSYSLKDFSLINTFTREFKRKLIKSNEGRLDYRGLIIEDISQGGKITHYPAIFGLDYIPSKRRLLVWTSQRNSSHQQMIDVYDDNMFYLGSDFKPTDPIFSDYYFVNDKIVVPDYGFGKEFYLDFLSPLDPPYFPSAISIFPITDI